MELQGDWGGRLDTGASRTLDIAACCGMLCAAFVVFVFEFASTPTKATLLKISASYLARLSCCFSPCKSVVELEISPLAIVPNGQQLRDN